MKCSLQKMGVSNQFVHIFLHIANHLHHAYETYETHIGSTNKKVNVKTCEKNSLKLLYYTESINGVVYNDCGCSDQFVNESSAKICKGSSCRYDSKTKLTICDPVD